MDGFFFGEWVPVFFAVGVARAISQVRVDDGGEGGGYDLSGSLAYVYAQDTEDSYDSLDCGGVLLD